ncbi:GntR family transcriptional regulator [Novosphingobium sp. PP1Y]|uniref:GntR family transcriptional regulator n=1 Tax=Novosphingobium sp. PP1Y TaxID=702113 RepID=UPI00020EFDDA|nr:GntR family transcriptional regulator [Novosphingobium sp. PP1Y]CCA90942.1 GntR family transcriptional regulator [Novosphingobium sp. PP1Y]
MSNDKTLAEDAEVDDLASSASVAHEAEPGSEQHIYQSIFDSVLNQRLVAGTKLPEPSLCTLFGASRGVIRKVLQRLENDRIVMLRPNKSAIVAVPTPEETRIIFEARRALEVSIVELATMRHSAKDMNDLRKMLAHEGEMAGTSNQRTWVACAREFHLKIAAIAGNPILTDYLAALMTRCSLIVSVYQPIGNAVCEHQEHARIIDYMEKRDVASARAEMGKHLRKLEDNISLDQRSSPHTLAEMLNLC